MGGVLQADGAGMAQDGAMGKGASGFQADPGGSAVVIKGEMFGP
jgi:hypothetical protein